MITFFTALPSSNTFYDLFPKWVHEKNAIDLWKRSILHARLMFYKDVFKLHLRDSSETFCDLSRTSLRLGSYIMTGMTLSRPRDNLRLWLWPDGPFRGHDVEFLALMTVPRCSDKALMPPLSSARQILTSVSLISSTDPAAARSGKVKASDICFCGAALCGDTAWLFKTCGWTWEWCHQSAQPTGT